MEHAVQSVVSPLLLRQFDPKFVKSGISLARLEFEDYVEFAGEIKKAPATDNFINDVNEQVPGVSSALTMRTTADIDDELLLEASQQFEYRQQIEMHSDRYNN